ncbi:sigma-54 interaction domain-containing protein [Sinanaerobacter sp. ZZT-01]|uniref:sigma-54 interaction domain-containing protein n=1 Tax=Sinanaerobacter sp. ZZT-01 TaxID=3111540 RepID=UPI002D7893E1|nr:sigma 54-interacting transcriptional regulator [Sinanaerobacter sp. ZZT-01]WRR94392.1 sigma 54-interacting transcriptional regulator [Sinanaerobacter sp. ZZT-01]
MERIAVIANNKKYAKYLTDNLETYFRDRAEFHYYGTNEIEAMETIREKYIVLSAFTIFQQVKKKTTKEARLIIADLTLNRKFIDRLYKLPKATKALLVNIDYRSCMEVITMIYSAGFKDLELIPFYAGCQYDKSIRVAITPDEEQLVPAEITTVINIGQRVVDLSCIWEIADYLGITEPFSSEEAEHAKKDIISSNIGIKRVLGENESLAEQINVLLKLVRQGFLVTDVKGKIYLSNDMAKQMLRSRTEIIEGFNITEVLPELQNANTHPGGEEHNGDLINVNGVNLIASVTKIISHDEIKGSVIMLDNFLEAENRQHKIRRKITGYGHIATYTFDNILGESEILEEAKKIAMRMAKSDSSMILYGETGTGKELFAQSVHNYSNRAGYYFVAVNCSALPENLLESELYGYEEGAFSGAKKGGKIGLFELAHQGTLFLDEIGELPLSQQAKLLRAIEEKKILRVGGMNLIDIDVRVVVATNRNLLEMVNNKEFRSDLYYRLNVLPVYIPSLKERGNDIFLLFDSFKKTLHAEFQLSAEARSAMLSHSWNGNVRELKNNAEYLANLGKKKIEASDLPFAEKDKNINCFGTDSKKDAHLIKEFLQMKKASLNKYGLILEEMEQAYRRRERIGRYSLLKRANDKNVFLTEQEIRAALSKLCAYGFVVSGKGRKGSEITELGKILLNQIKGR